jgi:tetratricopeptide (TPR) repeat protein
MSEITKVLVGSLGFVAALLCEPATGAETGQWKAYIDGNERVSFEFVRENKVLFMVGIGRAYAIWVAYPDPGRHAGPATIKIFNGKSDWELTGELVDKSPPVFNNPGTTYFLQWDMGLPRAAFTDTGKDYNRVGDEFNRFLDFIYGAERIIISTDSGEIELPRMNTLNPRWFTDGTARKIAIEHNESAWSSFLSGDLVHGLSEANLALGIMPEQAGFLDTRGQISLALGRIEEACADLDRAVNGYARRNLEKPGTFNGRGRCYELLAIADYQKAMEQVADNDYDRSMQAKASERIAALNADPSVLTDAYLKRAEKLVDSGRDQEANALFGLALARDASVNPKIQAIWAAAYVKRGEKLLEDERDQEGEALFALALGRDPTLGRRIDETRVRTAIIRGNKLVNSSSAVPAQMHEAVSHFDRASAIAKGAGIPIDSSAFEGRGRAYAALKRYTDAISDFKEAKRLGSVVADNLVWWTVFRQGVQLREEGKPIEGLVTIWTNLLNTTPEAHSWINQSQLLRQSDFWEAISRVYVGLPTSSQAANVTQCDRLTSHPEDPLRIAPGVPFDSIDAPLALAACKEAVEDRPGEPRYLYLRGRAHDRAASIAENVKDEVATKANDAAALADYQAATAKGYPMAFNNMALAFAQGLGVAKNEGRAQAFQLQTLNHVLYCCWAPVARHLLASATRNSTFDSEAVHRVVRELTLWSAALGSPDAHSLLNELIAKGVVATAELPSSANFTALPPWLKEFPLN